PQPHRALKQLLGGRPGLCGSTGPGFHEREWVEKQPLTGRVAGVASRLQRLDDEVLRRRKISGRTLDEREVVQTVRPLELAGSPAGFEDLPRPVEIARPAKLLAEHDAGAPVQGPF